MENSLQYLLTWSRLYSLGEFKFDGNLLLIDMATPRATYQRKRSRKKSFSGGKKAEVQSLFQAYAQQGLGLVDIMFKLHDTAVDDIP